MAIARRYGVHHAHSVAQGYLACLAPLLVEEQQLIAAQYHGAFVGGADEARFRRNAHAPLLAAHVEVDDLLFPLHQTPSIGHRDPRRILELLVM